MIQKTVKWAVQFFLVCLFSFGAILSVQALPKFKVVTTFTIIQDIAQNIAKDKADVESIIPPGVDIHNYQPTPKDIAKVQQAKLILWNGFNLERWFEKFFADVKSVPAFVVTEGIKPLPIYEGSYKGISNPHAWMSLSDALIYVENIKNALVENDPQNKDFYIKNAKIYAQEIKNLKQELSEKFSTIPPNKKTLVTSEGAFSYFVRDFGFKELYLWPINADQQGTPRQVKKVIDEINAANIPVVFSESTVSNKPALQVANETNAVFGGFLYVDSLSLEDGPAASYLGMMRTNGEIIINAFKGALH